MKKSPYDNSLFDIFVNTAEGLYLDKRRVLLARSFVIVRDVLSRELDTVFPCRSPNNQ